MSSADVKIQDRRGFESLIVFGAGLMMASILLCVFLQWHVWVSATVFLLGFTTWYTAMQISQPPRNDAFHFMEYKKRNTEKSKRPVLLCIGDSLTHGACSANYVKCINPSLLERLNQESNASSQDNFDTQYPLHIVNGGQNSICCWTVLHERLDTLLNACSPDYVLLWIGTNDLRSVYKASWGREMVKMWKLPQEPTVDDLLLHVKAMLNRMMQHESIKRIGVCTLPPMGEDVTNAKANRLVKETNVRIEKLVASEVFREKYTVVPVYKTLERRILSTEGRRNKVIPVDYFLLLGSVMSVMHHLFGLSWKICSGWIGNVVLSDSLHLNEVGRDVVASAVAEWLVSSGVAETVRGADKSL